MIKTEDLLKPQQPLSNMANDASSGAETDSDTLVQQTSYREHLAGLDPDLEGLPSSAPASTASLDQLRHKS